MNSTELQLFTSVIRTLLLTTPSVIAACLLTIKYDEASSIFWPVIGFQLLILWGIRKVFLSRMRSARDHVMIDMPQPTSIDFIKRIILPVLEASLTILGSSFIVVILWYWGMASLVGWLLGMALLASWHCGLRMTLALSTAYLLTDTGLTIYYGLDRISIPYSAISEISFSKTVKTDITKLARGIGRTNILGVRNHSFVIFRIRAKSALIQAWFPEIYLTPTNPNLFVKNSQ